MSFVATIRNLQACLPCTSGMKVQKLVSCFSLFLYTAGVSAGYLQAAKLPTNFAPKLVRDKAMLRVWGNDIAKIYAAWVRFGEEKALLPAGK